MVAMRPTTVRWRAVGSHGNRPLHATEGLDNPVPCPVLTANVVQDIASHLLGQGSFSMAHAEARLHEMLYDGLLGEEVPAIYSLGGPAYEDTRPTRSGRTAQNTIHFRYIGGGSQRPVPNKEKMHASFSNSPGSPRGHQEADSPARQEGIQVGRPARPHHFIVIIHDELGRPLVLGGQQLSSLVIDHIRHIFA